MAKRCPICYNGLSAYVREKSNDGKQPSAIIKAIEYKYGHKLTYAQLRNHMKNHDEVAGTYVMAKRGATKKLEEAIVIKDRAVDLMKNVQEFFDTGWSKVQNIDWEGFDTLPIDRQIKIMGDIAKVMGDYKKIEMQQQKLDMDRNPTIDNFMKIMSRSIKKTDNVEE